MSLCHFIKENNQDLTFRKPLEKQPHCLHSRRLTRAALGGNLMYPCTVLINSKWDRSLIYVNAVHHETFFYVLKRFEQISKTYTPYSPKRRIKSLKVRDMWRKSPRIMTVVQVLGLLFSMYRKRGSIFVLTMLFGTTDSVGSFLSA